MNPVFQFYSSAHRCLIWPLLFIFGLSLIGCGGGSTPTVSVAFTPSAAQTIDQGQTVSVTAAVANDTGAKGVTWTVSPASGAGTLSGATTTSVTYTAPASVSANTSVTITGTSIADGTKSASLKVTVTPAPSVTTSSLPAGTVGVAYSQTLQASGGAGTLTWSLASGALPNGLSLSGAGAISGTPTATGASTFTVKVTDSGSPALNATKQLSLTVNPAALAIVTTTLSGGTVNSTYGAMLQASGGTTPYTWSVTAGTLPAGLALNAATGQISGIPTTSGTSTFTITVTDSTTPTVQTKSKQLSITINAVLSVSTASLPNGTVGTAYSQQLQPSGGTSPITWAVITGTLPSGLSLNANSGTISGNPTTAGAANFTVQAKDSSTPQQSSSKALSITINTAPLSITTTSLPSATVGISYSQTLQSSGGTPPVAWTITTGTLPAGLSLNANTGAISGTPTTGGTSNFTVKVTDSTTPTAQTATQALSIVVNTATCGTGSESELNGQYAFLLQGFDASGPVAIGGSFTADGTGKITAGLEDVNSVSGVSNPSVTTATSSYSVGSDNRGCLTLVTGATTSIYRFSLGALSGTPAVAATGHIISFDATGTNVTGTLRKQDATAFSVAQFSGDYAFGAASARAAGSRFAVAGRFTASAGTLTSVVVDTNDGGTPMANLSLTGTYTVAGNGRGTIMLATGSSPVHAAFYIVSANEALLLSIDPQTGVNANSLFGGSVLKQVGKPFGISSLNGTDILYVEVAGTTAGTSAEQLGILKPAGNGTFQLTQDQNDGGTITAGASLSGTYTVDASGNGRVTVAGVGSTPPVLYLVGQDKAFLVGTSSGVESGFFEPQSGVSASGSYAFGSITPIAVNNQDQAGVGSFATPNVAGTIDKNNAGTLTANSPFSSTFSIDSTGHGLMPAGCSLSGGTCQDVILIVSPTKLVLLEVASGKTNPNLQIGNK